MVYHCLRRPGAKAYAGEETRIEWEDHLIQDVCKYLKKIVGLVGPTEQVFVGVDGVVPMAKMRQQRLRRFKSHWTAAEEIRIGKSTVGLEGRWDTNSITPGTAFMERLGAALCKTKTPGVRWVVSTADEPGEGEHKAMRGIRECSSLQSHVVYGLDADLIVLSMLQPVKEMWLFREAVECGEVQYTGDEEEYRYFSIHKLREAVAGGHDEHYLLDYAMAMSFVGNDFLPHGLSLKLKDGGHDILLAMLKDVRGVVGPLIVDGAWSPVALRACIDWLARREIDWVRLICAGKLGQRFQAARGTTPVEMAVDEWNKTPLRAAEELALVSAQWRNEDNKTQIRLRDDWQDVYHQRWLGARDVEHICEQYIAGLDWILKYYTGAEVSKEWCFPWFLPPLWSDLSAFLSGLGDRVIVAPAPTGFQVKPQEQLALVMPMASWWLVRDPNLRRLPRQAPQLWPSSFQLFTAGHKQIWECEAQIPLFTPERLRFYLSQQKVAP